MEGKKAPDKRDPEIHERRAARLADIKSKKEENLTIADRLTRRALERTIDIQLTDSSGKFTVEIHTPTRDELDGLLALSTLMGGGDTIEAQQNAQKASETLYHILANLCVDQSLNFEFWNEGAYDTNDVVLIIKTIVEQLADSVKKAKSFRKK